MEIDAAERRTRLIEDQQRWECEAVARGVRRYQDNLRKALSAGNEADTPPGMRMMMGVMTEMVPRVAQYQTDAVASMNTRGITRAWAVPVLALSAEKWSLIAARTALSFGRQDRPATQVALAIANRGQEERRFELFIEAQRKEAAEKRKAGITQSTFMARMIREAGKMRPRQAQAMMRKAKSFDRLEWPLEQRVHIGMLLINALVEGGGGWFEISMYTRTKGGRIHTERRVALTQAASDYFVYHHAQGELTRPWMLPMLCPPNDWRVVSA